MDADMKFSTVMQMSGPCLIKLVYCTASQEHQEHLFYPGSTCHIAANLHASNESMTVKIPHIFGQQRAVLIIHPTTGAPSLPLTPSLTSIQSTLPNPTKAHPQSCARECFPCAKK